VIGYLGPVIVYLKWGRGREMMVTDLSYLNVQVLRGRQIWWYTVDSGDGDVDGDDDDDDDDKWLISLTVLLAIKVVVARHSGSDIIFRPLLTTRERA